MAKEICISSTPHETRLAILEDDQLAEIYYERENEYTLAGSIYNGKVTRVLPGMQSAFVDLGLERDAFLYVTDFIELEDQEETDELERAAASGAGQAPREVHHPHGVVKDGGRQDERGGRNGQKGQQRQPQAQRPEQRPADEAAPESAAAPESTAFAGATEADRESEAGGGRWRGRRRRRGGRGRGDSPQTAPTPGTIQEETPAGAGFAQEVHVPEEPETPRARGHQAAPAFVLPGESLSKYGATPGGESENAAPEQKAPPRRAFTSKPSTLVEAPITWDGSGLLPGESISKLRSHQAAASSEVGAESQVESESRSEVSAAAESESIQGGQNEVIEEVEELVPAEVEELEAFEPLESPDEFEKDYFVSHSEEPAVGEEMGEEPADELAEDPETTEEETAAPEAADDPEPDASASHHVDPSSPSGFRLFGLGKKKKEAETAAENKKADSPAPVSSYAPGAGLVEEEVIEGEEMEATHHARRHKPEAHDSYDYEEETLPAQARSGDLGEMLQEAHLDHRIDMNLGAKAGEEEDFETEEEEEEPAAGAQPAPGRERRDRHGRPQRGRPAPGRRGGPSRRSAQTSDLPIISDLLKPGQEILVQIAKEPIAKKGARITSHIALPGRFLVFMPTVTHVGVSRKIASDEERHRLKRILVSERGDAQGGFIVRTAAEGASEEELRADLRFLMNLWNDIKQRSESLPSPALIYRDLSLIERILRDQVSSNFTSIWVDSQEDYERIVRFLNRFSPTLVRRVKLYTKETPLFEHFGIQDEISKALRSKVWLKSGGSIVINQTEALVAIDINTGKYVGKSARLEDTIVKTNLDAVPEIARQIRLRDLGGIIVIDFIDMDERKNRFRVLAALEEALKADRAPTKVLQFNDFGLVAITRKRVKQSLERTLSVSCPTCQATGMVKSPTTVCNEIYTEMRKMRKHFESQDVMLRVHPETVKVLKSNNARWLTEFEELTGRNLLLKSDPTLHPEQFDIQG